MKSICLKIDKCTCHLSFLKLILYCKAIFKPKMAYINPILVHRSSLLLWLLVPVAYPLREILASARFIRAVMVEWSDTKALILSSFSPLEKKGLSPIVRHMALLCFKISYNDDTRF